MLAQTWAIDGYLRMWWTDARLAFDDTSNGGCTDEITLDGAGRNRIWKPRIYWDGAVKVTLPKDSDPWAGELLKVQANGGVWWSRQVSLVLGCPFSDGDNLARLPYFTQRCGLTMGMYAETAAEIRIRWKEESDALSSTQAGARTLD